MSVKEFILTWVDLFFESLIDLFFLIDLSLKTLGLKKRENQNFVPGIYWMERFQPLINFKNYNDLRKIVMSGPGERS